MLLRSVLFATIGNCNFQPTVCKGCNDVSMLSFDLNNTTILNIYGADYNCIIFGMSKDEAIYILTNFGLSEKSGSLQYKKNNFFLFVIIKVNNKKMKTYEEQNKKKLKEDTRNCYYLKNDKEK